MTPAVVIKEYQSGVSSTKLARRLGLCRMTVLKLLRSWGVPIRHRGVRRNEDLYRNVLILKRKGFGSMKIARQLKTSKQTVWKVVSGKH